MSFIQEMLLTSLQKTQTECDLRSSHSPTSDNHSLRGFHNNSDTPQVIVDSQNEKKDGRKQTYVDYPYRIDKYSRALFPLVFIVFNCTYWITYLTISTRDDLTGFVTP